jgi:hypothetical protein
LTLSCMAGTFFIARGKGNNSVSQSTPVSIAPQSDPTLNLQNAIIRQGTSQALDSIRVLFFTPHLCIRERRGTWSLGVLRISRAAHSNILPKYVSFLVGLLQLFLLGRSPKLTLSAYHHFSELPRSASEHRVWRIIISSFPPK